MSKINAGSNATVALTAGQVISVSSGGGLLRFEYPAGTVLFEGDGADQTFGPFSSSGSCVVTSLIGAIDYVVSTPPGQQSIPYILAQRGAPTILPSSGSSNATGQITLTTALPYQPSGTVGLYLPAGVVTGGSQGSGAGVYQVTFSSTTVCQLAGTSIVTANAAYTQTTGAQLTLASTSVPAGCLGVNGCLRVMPWWTHIGNTNIKIERAVFGGTWLADRQATSATQVTFRELLMVRNRGAQNSNLLESSWGGGIGADTGLFKSASIDTSLAQTLAFTGQLSIATDYIILEGYSVEVLPAA